VYGAAAAGRRGLGGKGDRVEPQCRCKSQRFGQSRSGYGRQIGWRRSSAAALTLLQWRVCRWAPLGAACFSSGICSAVSYLHCAHTRSTALIEWPIGDRSARFNYDIRVGDEENRRHGANGQDRAARL
jgi:hypothetical protein